MKKTKKIITGIIIVLLILLLLFGIYLFVCLRMMGENRRQSYLDHMARLESRKPFTIEEPVNYNKIKQSDLPDDDPETKGTNLSDMYFANPTDYKVIVYDIGTVSVEKIKVIGLKDEEVLKRVNTIIDQGYNDVFDFNNVTKVCCDVYGDFNNILSFKVTSYADTKEIKSFYGNIDLASGKEISFPEIFTKDADYESMIRKVYSNESSLSLIGDFNKMLESNDRDRFLISEDRVYIKPSAKYMNTISILYRDNMEFVEVYDRFKTEESIFTEPINELSKRFCGSYINNMRHYYFDNDNLFLDYNVDYNESSYESVYKNYSDRFDTYESFMDEKYEIVKKEIFKLRDIANKNKDKMYILTSSTVGKIYGDYFNPEYVPKYENTEGCYVNVQYYVYEMDKSYYDEVFKYDLAKNYRDIYDRYNIEYEDDENDPKVKVTSFCDTGVYNFMTGYKYTKFDELFDEGVDYKSILKHEIKFYMEYVYSIAQPDSLLEKYADEATFAPGEDSVSILVPELENYNLTLDFRYLNDHELSFHNE